jgi:pyruvate formate lyase activating enzyme
MNGIIFSVKRYSIHDGPGIRVTFFMKGCPLSCWWCHNPEGISPQPEEIEKLTKVGDREFRKSEIVGKSYPVEEILNIAEKERVFMEKSNGGVTFSGGEPMMQAEFLIEALKGCRERGFHTAVDTSGYCPAQTLEKIIPFTNLFLFDLKHPDNVRHLEYTGVTNENIIRNFKLILKSKADLMIRIPVIPGFNDSEDDMSEFKRFIHENKNENIKMINLLSYHKIGSSKYKRFNRPYKMGSAMEPSAEKMEELKKYFAEEGIKVKIGG